MATNKNFVVKNGLEIGGQEVVNSSGVVTSAALGGQTVSSTDSPTFNNLTLTNDIAVGGDINLTGDLNITGDVNSLSVTDLDVTDKTITLGSGQVESASGGSGIIVDGSSASILWDETNTEWDFNNTINVTGAVVSSSNGGITTPAATTARFSVNETGGAITAMEARGSTGTIGTRSNHTLGFLVNDAQKATLTAGGDFTVTNDLKLTTTNPRIDYDNNGNGALRFYSMSTAQERMRITSGGNVGIGNSDGTFNGTGTRKVQIETAAASSLGPELLIHNAGQGADALAAITFGGKRSGLEGYTASIHTTNNDGLHFGTAAATDFSALPTTRMVIDTNGNVGIGGAPSFTFQVRSPSSTAYSAYNFLTSPNIAFSNATSGAGYYNSLLFGTESNGEVAIGSVQNSVNTASDFVIAIRSGGNRLERMRIDSDGNVGIGTDSPAVKFHVNGTNASIGVIGTPKADWYTTAYNGLQVADGLTLWGRVGDAHMSGNYYVKDVSGVAKDSYINTGYAHDLWFDNSSGDLKYRNAASGSANGEITSFPTRFIIKNNGNVGIGDTNPDQKLVVKDGNIKLKSNADGNTGILMLYDAAGAQSGQVYPSAGDLRIWSPNDVLILPTGKVGIGTDSPSFKLHAYHPTTNVVSRFESGDPQVWIDLHDSNSGTYGALLGHEPGNGRLFQIADSSVNERLVLDNSGNLFLQSESQNRIVFGNTGDDFTINNSNNWIRGSAGSLQFNAASTGYVWEAAGAARLAMSHSGVITQTTAGTSDSYDMILRSTDSGDPGLSITRDGVVGFGIAVRAATNDYVDFQVNNGGATSYTEEGKMRIYHNGNISIPGSAEWSTSVGNTFGTTGNHYMIRSANSTGNESIIINNTTSGGSLGILQYRISGGVQGQYLIGTSGSGITFTGSSDYRLKENVSTITESSLDKINQLRLVSYNWNEHSDMPTDELQIGVIAHEIEEVFPEFVDGEKDAVYTQEELDARGDPVSTNEEVGDIKAQSVSLVNKDMIIHILKGMQELKAENEALKARIEVLEG